MNVESNKMYQRRINNDIHTTIFLLLFITLSQSQCIQKTTAALRAKKKAIQIRPPLSPQVSQI